MRTTGSGNCAVRAALVSAFVIAVSACAGGSADTTTTQATTTETTSTTVLTTTTTTAAVPPATTTTTQPEALIAFCALDADTDVVGEQINAAVTPEQFEAAYRDFQMLMERGVEIAPAELQTDAEVVRSAVVTLIERLDAAGFDLLNMDPDEAEAMFADIDAAASVASDRIADWVDANCNGGPAETTTSSPT